MHAHIHARMHAHTHAHTCKPVYGNLFFGFYKCRVELQDVKSNNLSMSVVNYSKPGDPKEPTYDIIDGTQMVNMTPNPAYGTSTSGKKDVKMTANPAYGTSYTIKNTEEPAYM